MVKKMCPDPIISYRFHFTSIHPSSIQPSIQSMKIMMHIFIFFSSLYRADFPGEEVYLIVQYTSICIFRFPCLHHGIHSGSPSLLHVIVLWELWETRMGGKFHHFTQPMSSLLHPLLCGVATCCGVSSMLWEVVGSLVLSFSCIVAALSVHTILSNQSVQQFPKYHPFCWCVQSELANSRVLHNTWRCQILMCCCFPSCARNLVLLPASFLSFTPCAMSCCGVEWWMVGETMSVLPQFVNDPQALSLTTHHRKTAQNTHKTSTWKTHVLCKQGNLKV